jgi:phosphate transport system substrate-binding protein
MFSMRTHKALIPVVAGLVLWISTAAVAHADALRTGGTGAALATMRQLGAAFAKREPDIRIDVIEGLGSSGGIAAVTAGAIDFSFSGRPLTAADDQTLKAKLFARTPFGLASSNPHPGNLGSSDVANFVGSANSVWPDGTPARLILRPKTDSDAQLLARSFPNMADVLDKLRSRAEIPVAVTDQDNATLGEKLAGSLTAMTLLQLQSERLRLGFVAIDGVAPTLENFESGRYPYGKDIYLVIPSRRAPALERFIAFLDSAEGRGILRANGGLATVP